jgi:hypothetical protein
MNRPGGFTAVSRNTLVNSLSVARNNIRLSPSQMSRVSAIHSLGVSPSRASVMGSSVARAVPPRNGFARPVVSRMAAPNRTAFSGASRGVAFNSSQARAGAMAGARSVPRPPNAAGFRGPGGGESGNRGMGASTRYSEPQMSRNNVPRPPSASRGRGESSYSRGASSSYGSRAASPSYTQRGGAAPSAPRTNERTGPRGALSAPRPAYSGGYSQAPTRDSFDNRSVPRPSASVVANNRMAESYGRSSAYGGDNYGRSMRSYGGNYGRPSYDGGSYGRSMSLPSYARNYGGAYSGERMPSYGGSFGARSSGSFGGGRAYSGGSHIGGGGGHGGGGGGHVSGGGHSGGGGSHGGRR